VAVSLVPFSSLAAVARKSVGASLAQMAMVASGDDTARLWNVATRQQVGTALSGATNLVYSVAFSPDRNTLAAGYGDGLVQLSDVRYLTNVVSFLCASAGGSFTPEEWRQYVQGPAYQKTCP
jgi:WD40 repeat protein